MKRFGSWWVALLVSLAAWADDVGNSPADAQPVTPDAPTLNRSIEYDVDHDWYYFRALPWIPYTIAASTGTIWDVELRLLAASGSALLRYTNSAHGAPAQVVYLTTGAAQRVALDVSGLVEFTTGTYSLSVSSALVDSDVDGLPDAWENAQLGSLTNGPAGDFDGDGFDNRSEYLAGTLAFEETSSLQFTSVAGSSTNILLVWQAAPDATYQVAGAPLAGGVWSNLGATIIATGANAFYQAETSGVSQAFRLNLVY